MPDSMDAWAEVELFRWQYGELPLPDDTRPLIVPAGLRGMAQALRKGDIGNIPTVYNVGMVLEYAARLLSKEDEDATT